MNVRRREGQSLIEFALILPLLLILVFGIIDFSIALAIDIGYAKVAENELQNVADAAALAGARQMGQNYYDGASPVVTGVTSVVGATAAQNRVTGLSVAADNVGTLTGLWNADTRALLVPAPNNLVMCVATPTSPIKSSDSPP